MNSFFLFLVFLYAFYRVESGRVSTERLRMIADMEWKFKKMSKLEKYFESKSIREQLFKLPQYKAAERIATYLNRPEQPDTEEIFKQMLKDGKEVFIPWVDEDGELEIVETRGLSDLNLPLNPFGFRQPNRTIYQCDGVKSGGLDFMIIPGKAFTKDGYRLGTWKGWYYPYVRAARNYRKNMTVVGLAWRHQIVDMIPGFSHPEIKVDIVLYHKEE